MSDVRSSSRWWASPAARIIGATASWFVMGLSFALLFLSTVGLIGVGGTCASGGPYEIAVECPAEVALFMPLSIFGGFVAVGISLGVARGFGTPMLTLAWPILFCGLGALFLLGFAADPGAWSWLLVGVLFEVMGLVPLVVGLVADARQVVIGSVSAEGAPFAQRRPGRAWLTVPRRPRAESVAPSPRDWLLAVGTTLVGGGLGVVVGLALFQAASASPR